MSEVQRSAQGTRAYSLGDLLVATASGGVTLRDSRICLVGGRTGRGSGVGGYQTPGQHPYPRSGEQSSSGTAKQRGASGHSARPHGLESLWQRRGRVVGHPASVPQQAGDRQTCHHGADVAAPRAGRQASAAANRPPEPAAAQAPQPPPLASAVPAWHVLDGVRAAAAKACSAPGGNPCWPPQVSSTDRAPRERPTFDGGTSRWGAAPASRKEKGSVQAPQSGELVRE